MEGWADLDGWLYTETVYLSATDTHPRKLFDTDMTKSQTGWHWVTSLFDLDFRWDFRWV